MPIVKYKDPKNWKNDKPERGGLTSMSGGRSFQTGIILKNYSRGNTRKPGKIRLKNIRQRQGGGIGLQREWQMVSPKAAFSTTI